MGCASSKSTSHTSDEAFSKVAVPVKGAPATSDQMLRSPPRTEAADPPRSSAAATAVNVVHLPPCQEREQGATTASDASGGSEAGTVNTGGGGGGSIATGVAVMEQSYVAASDGNGSDVSSLRASSSRGYLSSGDVSRGSHGNSQSNSRRGSAVGDCGYSSSGTPAGGKVYSDLEAKRKEGDLKERVVHIEFPFGKPIEEVYTGVHNGPVLGSGISGLVRLATHKATGVQYAVKCMDLGLIETEEGLHQLREEIYIMCQLDHPNIVRLEEVYEGENEIYLVQELCLGGELFDRLEDQPDYHYTEEQCARLVKQMLCAVRYIHSKGIIHRDLKLENFLFSNASTDSELKLIDFGLSKHFQDGDVQNEAVGTPYTVAPEVVRGFYNERCDVWAIGVITFLLLSGDPPFGGCGGPEPLSVVRNNILTGSFKFEPEDIWCDVSQHARDFISTLLVTDPALRPAASQAQKMLWLREWANSERSRSPERNSSRKLSPNVVNALMNFKEYSDMRKLLCEVLSFTLLPDQIKHLRAEFEKMDTEGSGEISLSALKEVMMQNAGSGPLGTLSEDDVEGIFNAMRVRKSVPTIQWHEFVAAGLSQCQVDDRNLRLAFDRLDGDHKGYITLNDVATLVGNSVNEEALTAIYQESLSTCECKHAWITYEDFLLLMKGQRRRSLVRMVSGMDTSESALVCS